jgi:hypothetical protein
LKWMFWDADWICVLHVSQAAGGSSGQAGVVKRRRPSEPLLNVFTFRIIGRDGKPKKRKVRHTTTWSLQMAHSSSMATGPWTRWSQLLDS